MGGPRGRMISAPDRKKAIELINNAIDSGARLEPACDEVGITPRTYQRWTKGPEIAYDKRPTAKRPTPKNKLSEAEKTEILKVINNKDYADLVPNKIVPMLADKGTYLASESTIYRILREMNQNTHRLKSKEAVRREPAIHVATGLNQAWGIEITYIRLEHGFVYLTAIIDWYSRCIVALDLADTLDTASALNAVGKAFEIAKPDILNSDQGSQFTSNKYIEYLKEQESK